MNNDQQSKERQDLQQEVAQFRRRIQELEESEQELIKHQKGLEEDARAKQQQFSVLFENSPDAILLYAAARPTFVVDAYTKRVLRRHFVVDPTADYESTRQLLQRTIEPDVAVYNEFHALFVAVGKRHCRNQAQCNGCPLANMPHDGQR